MRRLKILLIALSFLGLLLTLTVSEVSAQVNHKSCRNYGLITAQIVQSAPGQAEWANTFAANNPGAVAAVNEQLQSDPNFCIQK